MPHRYLFVGSLPPPYHGQAIAFKEAVDVIKGDKKVVHTSFRGENLLHSLFLSLIYYFDILRIRFFYRPDVVYFLCSRSRIGLLRDVWLLLLFYFSNARVINHLHGSDFADLINGLPAIVKSIAIKLYERVNEHAVLIEPMIEQLKCINSEKKATIIHNFYGKEADDYIIAREVNYERPLTVLYLSSILPSKGIFELIEAVKQVSNSGCTIRLHVAGGFLADKSLSLEAVTQKFYEAIAGCEAFIVFEGVVTGEKKYQLLSKADVFVLPSYYKSEAVPLSIIEAMRMGCYIITTDFRYLPSLVVSGINGRLVEQESVDSLVDALRAIDSNRVELADVSSFNISHAEMNYSESLYKTNIKNFLLVSNNCDKV